MRVTALRLKSNSSRSLAWLPLGWATCFTSIESEERSIKLRNYELHFFTLSTDLKPQLWTITARGPKLMYCTISRMTAKILPRLSAGILAVSCMTPPVLSAEDGFPGLSPQGDTDAVRSSFKKPTYSPYAGRFFPTRVYWGDTHVHTDNSLDAKGFAH